MVKLCLLVLSCWWSRESSPLVHSGWLLLNQTSSTRFCAYSDEIFGLDPFLQTVRKRLDMKNETDVKFCSIFACFVVFFDRYPTPDDNRSLYKFDFFNRLLTCYIHEFTAIRACKVLKKMLFSWMGYSCVFQIALIMHVIKSILKQYF